MTGEGVASIIWKEEIESELASRRGLQEGSGLVRRIVVCEVFEFRELRIGYQDLCGVSKIIFFYYFVSKGSQEHMIIPQCLLKIGSRIPPPAPQPHT